MTTCILINNKPYNEKHQQYNLKMTHKYIYLYIYNSWQDSIYIQRKVVAISTDCFKYK